MHFAMPFWDGVIASVLASAVFGCQMYVVHVVYGYQKDWLIHRKQSFLLIYYFISAAALVLMFQIEPDFKSMPYDEKLHLYLGMMSSIPCMYIIVCFLQKLAMRK